MDLDAEAAAYASADFADVNAAFTERLLEIAPATTEAFAVDLGTGPGDIPLRVLRARPYWRVVAVDASFPMLEFAQGAATVAPIVWTQADAKRLPFAARSMDVVFSNSILHHITEVGLFWAEVSRIAKPGATVFLRDLARPGSPAAARAIVDKYAGTESPLLQEEFYRSLLSAYTPDEVRLQLAQAGLAGFEVVLSTDRHLDIFRPGP